MLSNLFKHITPQLSYGMIFFFCLGVVGYAYYAQFINNADSCPLCIAQRIIFALCSIVALGAMIHHSRDWANWIYSIVILALALFGIKTAAHHIWLQSLPPSEWPASCGMPLQILYKKIPLSGFIHTILSGSAECAMVNWKILGISAPILSLSAYVIVAVVALYILCSPRVKKQTLYWTNL